MTNVFFQQVIVNQMDIHEENKTKKCEPISYHAQKSTPDEL